MEILRCSHLTKIYGSGSNTVTALKDVSFSLERGSFTAIIGASGSGKSTLLHMLGGVDRPTSGSIYIEDTDISSLGPEQLAAFRRRKVGLVYQFYNLIPTLTVRKNILMPLTLDKKKPNKEYFDKVVGSLGIADKLEALPNQLSGGQQQRVAIARSLIYRPALLLADEPTGALDSHSSQMLLSTMQGIHEQMGATILMVTHDAFTASYANRILFLRDGEIFTELCKGHDSRSAFFNKILNVLTMIGGGQSHVC